MELKKKKEEITKERQYTTLMLIEDLSQEISKLVPSELYCGKLAYWKLSKYVYDINSKKGYDYIQKSILSRFNSNNKDLYNPNYKFSEEILNRFRENLRKNFGEKAQSAINFIDKYEKMNLGLKKASFQQWHKHKPKLNNGYFNIVDTIEKAYWLGFLMADGSIITKHYYYAKGVKYKRKSPKKEIFIELSTIDKILLERFSEVIGINKISIKKRSRIHYRTGNSYDYVYLRFDCKEMVNDLEAKNFTSSKSKRKKLPKITNYKLLLAFVRGYYDGDGFSGSTRLCASNKQFLVQMKQTLGIKHPILRSSKSCVNIDDYRKLHINRAQYSLAIGARLFNEMSSFCKKAGLKLLERKDKTFSESVDAYSVLKDHLKDLSIDKNQLQKLVYKYRQYELAKIFNISISTIRKLILEWNIKLPPNGYWKKVEKNKHLGNYTP